MVVQYLGQIHSTANNNGAACKGKDQKKSNWWKCNKHIYYRLKCDGRIPNCVLRLSSNTKFYDRKWFKRKESIGVSSHQKRDVLHSIPSGIKNQWIVSYQQWKQTVNYFVQQVVHQNPLRSTHKWSKSANREFTTTFSSNSDQISENFCI